MNPHDTTQPQSQSHTGYRPSYFAVGIDAAGRDHIYRTADATIHVIDDTDRVHVEELSDRPVDDWMAYVDERVGWTRRWMLGLAAMVERAADTDAEA